MFESALKVIKRIQVFTICARQSELSLSPTVVQTRPVACYQQSGLECKRLETEHRQVAGETTVTRQTRRSERSAGGRKRLRKLFHR